MILLSDAIQAFAQKFVESEKVFVTTDRHVYTPGERLSFSVFIVDGMHRVQKESSMVKLLLADGKDQAIDSVVAHVVNGRFSYFFMLPQNGGMYRIKASTRWQLNERKPRQFQKEIFVQQVTSGLTPPPQYFPKNAQLYKMGTSPFTQVNEFSSIAHCPNDFEKLATPQRPLILDTRSPLRYRDSFIPNSINIGLDGKFDSWVGTLVNDLQQKFLLVCEPGTDTVKQITANELTSSIINPHILDDRNTNEYNSQHLMIEHLQNIPFELLSTQMDKVKSSDNL